MKSDCFPIFKSSLLSIMRIDPRFLELVETSMRNSRRRALRNIVITLAITIPIFVWTLTWMDGNTPIWNQLEALSYPLTVLGWAGVIVGGIVYMTVRRFRTPGALDALNHPATIIWLWKVTRKMGKKSVHVVHIGTEEGKMYRVRGKLPWIWELYEAAKAAAPEAYLGFNHDYYKIFRKNPKEAKTYEIYREQRVRRERGEVVDEGPMRMEL